MSNQHRPGQPGVFHDKQGIFIGKRGSREGDARETELLQLRAARAAGVGSEFLVAVGLAVEVSVRSIDPLAAWAKKDVSHEKGPPRISPGCLLYLLG